jgi:hypothetical protein
MVEAYSSKRTDGIDRKFFQIKLCRLPKIADGFTHGLALRSSSCFWIEGNKATFDCGDENGCEGHGDSLSDGRSNVKAVLPPSFADRHPGRYQ